MVQMSLNNDHPRIEVDHIEQHQNIDYQNHLHPININNININNTNNIYNKKKHTTSLSAVDNFASGIS
jgi:hypothetical protein